ncbi:beta-galactosidase [Kribbella albertanoniae]|uniref:Beta-galactosidase n=1 Tax=Kribbella albertanoniae TaxID=1266829 RepID=A0A4R4PM43_9ACTN|nr:beta-galactosidase family protein [Kribbella albertanoniae]TDC23156.1 beta-galactosidase [Kribbella albertanoniae]
MPDFAIGESEFLLDGKPFQILSGALHYFRIHPDQWADRIEKARLMGLNTIETYVPWNAHSPRRGVFDTTGMLDLELFLRRVAEAGLHAIVRPGPYICAEWDNGGLPSWLFRQPGVGVRRYEPQYLAAVGEYFSEVLRIVRPLQVDQGGPVLLLQVENEYGAFGNDSTYLKWLVELFRAQGITVPLVTVDQPEDAMLTAGGIDGVLRTGSFGSRSVERLATLRAHQPTGPLMCMEFWDGWFDHWGGPHHTTSAAEAAAELDALLSTGASVNIYMVHGGTNFGLTNGANDKGVYRPTVTSYDYDAPVDEAGRLTAKFHAFREVIARHAPVPPLPEFDVQPPVPEFSATLGEPIRLLDRPDSWGAWRAHEDLPSLDDLDAQFALYRTQLDLDGPVVLQLDEVRDRAHVFLDGDPIGVLSREDHDRAITLPRGRGRLDLIVEDQGRVNYGSRIGEAKGLIGPLQVGTSTPSAWQTLAIDLDAVPELWRTTLQSTAGVGPTAYRAAFTIEEPTDLFLRTDAWGKGFAWINGFCLGRYWRRGPQHTLYIPGPALRAGTNELVVLELDTLADTTARFTPTAELGPTEL